MSGGEPDGAGTRGAASGELGRRTQASPDGDDDETPAQAQITGRQLREAAHRYLDNGLLPVPAWGMRSGGGCCCPRGADCDRPGKHPRSVRAGGPRAWSWKPLACHSHDQIEQRFAPSGRYAAGNLMVAVPDGMMAIDIDDDDGGRAAIAALAADLGELPPTLSHRTPHGEHLIYQTPPGWKGRAWVGKDPANPVPPGIDLRMPGQILMAAPSMVPGPGGPARYGPLAGDRVAALPAAYVTVWTPPAPPPRPAGRRVPVPPDSADRAARYVHDAMTRIAEDLASRQPGGRNAAAYTAGLKAGSLLGAARATPGAGQSAAAWTDEAAEQALMDAAERNGYTGKDGPAAARRAVRSGLANGLRNPRVLPDFTTAIRQAPGRRLPLRRPVPLSGPAGTQSGQSATAPARRTGRWQDLVPAGIRRQIEAADSTARDRRRAAIAAHQQAAARHARSATAGTAAEVERARAAAEEAHRAYTRDGRHVTGRHDAAMLRWAAAIAARREQAARQPAADSARTQASRAAVAANEAYKAGDLDRARELVDQAAALDASRAGLWQQHRDDIAARQLILSARAAHTEADHQRAAQLLQQARELDPRMRTLWDGSLPSRPPARAARQAPAPGPAGQPPADTASTTRTAAQPARAQPRQGAATAHPGEQAPQQAWPSAPARRQPDRAAPGTPDQARLQAQRPATAAAQRQPRAGPPVSGQAPDPFAAAGGSPARWPARAPHRQPQTPAPQAGPETRTTPLAAAGGSSGPAAAAAQAAPSADWRDGIIAAARQPWQQPGPSWPHHPALHRTPGTPAPSTGIEAGQ
jgi:hypothetical protein